MHACVIKSHSINLHQAIPGPRWSRWRTPGENDIYVIEDESFGGLLIAGSLAGEIENVDKGHMEWARLEAEPFWFGLLMLG